MSLRHWLWIAAGLAAWAGLVVLWATTPSICDVPAPDHHTVCGEAGASR